MIGRRDAMSGVAAALAAGALAFALVDAAPDVGFLARGALAGVLLFAGAAKLRDRRAFARSLEGLGLGALPATPVAAVELATAAALLVSAGPEAAIGALALMLAFTVVVGVALVRQQAADCGCFGAGRSTGLGGLTLVRNAALVGIAGALALTASQHHAALGPGRGLGAVASALAAMAALAVLLPRRTRDQQPAATVLTLPEEAGDQTTRRSWLVTAGKVGAAGAVTSLAAASPALASAGAPIVLAKGCTCGSCACCTTNCTKMCCTKCTCGFVGGGAVETPTGRAQASFFGTKLPVPRQGHLIQGGLVWSDPAWQGTGLQLVSTRLESYRRLPGSQVRELRGLASANGRGSHAFVLRVQDIGATGSGSDTVSLVVNGVAAGGAGGSGGQYTANGHIVEGDASSNFQGAGPRK
jgi:hypothetical protein